MFGLKLPHSFEHSLHCSVPQHLFVVVTSWPGIIINSLLLDLLDVSLEVSLDNPSISFGHGYEIKLVEPQVLVPKILMPHPESVLDPVHRQPIYDLPSEPASAVVAFELAVLDCEPGDLQLILHNCPFLVNLVSDRLLHHFLVEGNDVRPLRQCIHLANSVQI